MKWGCSWCVLAAPALEQILASFFPKDNEPNANLAGITPRTGSTSECGSW